VPDDPATADAALLAGRTVVEHAPDSPLRRAVAELASAIAPGTARRSGRKASWRSRRRLYGLSR
jgi:MinD-like ATPase involved in chromosome partitioning or flagellar assembly